MPMHRTNKSAGGKQTLAYRAGLDQVGRCEGWWVALRRHSRRRDALARKARRVNRRMAKGKLR